MFVRNSLIIWWSSSRSSLWLTKPITNVHSGLGTTYDSVTAGQAFAAFRCAALWSLSQQPMLFSQVQLLKLCTVFQLRYYHFHNTMEVFFHSTQNEWSFFPAQSASTAPTASPPNSFLQNYCFLNCICSASSTWLSVITFIFLQKHLLLQKCFLKIFISIYSLATLPCSVPLITTLVSATPPTLHDSPEAF